MDDFYSGRQGSKPPITTAALVELILRKLHELEQVGLFQEAFASYNDASGELRAASIPDPEQYVITHLARPGLFRWLGDLQRVVTERDFPNWDENTLFDVVELYYSVIPSRPVDRQEPRASGVQPDSRQRFRDSINQALALRKPPLRLREDGKIAADHALELPPAAALLLGESSTRHPPDADDVYISHASEDTGSIARPLAEALREHGHRVFSDEFELIAGDRLTSRIDEALAQSHRVVVILSPAFFAKEWPKRELDSLTTRELASGENLLIPVWHQVNATDVQRYSAALANRPAISSGAGLDVTVAAVERALQRSSENPGQPGSEGLGPHTLDSGTSVGTRRVRSILIPVRRAGEWFRRPPGPIATLMILIIAGVAVFQLTTNHSSPSTRLSTATKQGISTSKSRTLAQRAVVPKEQVTLRGSVVLHGNRRIGLLLRGVSLSFEVGTIRVRCLACSRKAAHHYVSVADLIGEVLPLLATLDITAERAGEVGRYIAVLHAGSQFPQIEQTCLTPEPAQPVACADEKTPWEHKLAAAPSRPQCRLALSCLKSQACPSRAGCCSAPPEPGTTARHSCTATSGYATIPCCQERRKTPIGSRSPMKDTPSHVR